jgi:hypothetical protein
MKRLLEGLNDSIDDKINEKVEMTNSRIGTFSKGIVQVKDQNKNQFLKKDTSVIDSDRS